MSLLNLEVKQLQNLKFKNKKRKRKNFEIIIFDQNCAYQIIEWRENVYNLRKDLTNLKFIL